MQPVGRSHLLHSECPTRMLARQARQIVGVPVFGEHRAAGRNEEEMIADGCVPEEQTNLGRAFAVFSDDAPLRVFDEAGKQSFASRGDIQILGDSGYKMGLADAIHKDVEKLALEARWGTHANISH